MGGKGITKRIAVFTGSCRFNRKLANVLKTISPKSPKLEVVEIGGFPLGVSPPGSESHERR
jgi:hypothetical protein